MATSSPTARFAVVSFDTVENASSALEKVQKSFMHYSPKSKDLSHIDGNIVYLDATAYYGNNSRTILTAFLMEQLGALPEICRLQ